MSAKREHAPIDGMILAFAQLSQPTDAATTFELALGSAVAENFDEREFRRYFFSLTERGYLWRTANNKFVVTPKGDELVLRTMRPRNRDKLRMLYLNHKRLSGGWVRDQ